MVARRSLFALFLPVALAACSAGGGVDSTDPILLPVGDVSPQRNLLMSDLSAGSPGNGRAVDEEFELPATHLMVSSDSGSTGLLRREAARESFSDGNTMNYFAAENRFVFDIQTDAGNFQRTLFNIQFQDPAPDNGIENSQEAKLIYSNANGIASTFAGQNDALDAATTIGEIAAALTALSESEDEADNDLYNAIINRASDIINVGDQLIYYYVFTGGYGYYEATNMNDSEETRVTDTVAIGSFVEYYDTGETLYGHHVLGHRTPLPEVPTTGAANFEGKIVGSVLTNNSVRSLTGSVFLDVDFETNLMDIEIGSIIREGANHFGGTTFLPYKDLEGNGVITDTVFNGTLREIGGDSSGEFEGGFFGPVANEAGGTFTFGNDASYSTGAFTAKQVADNN